MIGVDTNVLVRYLVQDDPEQSPIATAFIERQLNAGNPGFVSLVVLVELAWVLRTTYRVDNEELAAIIGRLLEHEGLVLEREREVFGALGVLKARRGSFADALIGALGTTAGCVYTVTFDQKTTRMPEFALLVARH